MAEEKSVVTNDDLPVTDIDEFRSKVASTKAELKKVFTPSRPVTNQNIFSGRKEQIKECCSILETPGLHGILYGERGVGRHRLLILFLFF